ncbi:hypothetical protein [Microbacterium enclense]|uniref:hypothetical protein n=1 Tax=Microbacterium enclense TaxID=993073 RepID=UPI003D713AD1
MLTPGSGGEVVRATFTAAFDAHEHHPLEGRSYGPDRCRRCGEGSWPQAPLPQAPAVIDDSERW